MDSDAPGHPDQAGRQRPEVLEHLSDAFFAVDADWRLVDLNAECARLMRQPREALLGRNLWEAFPDAIDSSFDHACRRARATGSPAGFEAHYPPYEAWYDGRVYPSAGGVAVVFRDVTAERSSAARLRHLAAVVDASGDAITSSDLDGVITSWNAGAERLYGYTAAEMLGRPVAILQPEGVRDHAELLARLRAGEVVQHYETRRRRKDGILVDISLTLGPIRAEDGTVVGISASAHDISQRKGAEAALREAEERYRALVEGLPGATYIYTPYDEITATYISPQIEQITGHPVSLWDTTPGGWLHAIHPDDVERVLAEALRTDASGEPFDLEHRYVTPDGRTVWVRNEAWLVRDEQGEPRYWQGFVRDITAQKLAEERAREQTEVTETLYRVGQLLLAELDHDTLVQAVTDEATRLTGAQFGAFFYHLPDQGTHTLYAISGAPREAFASFPTPRNTSIFGATFRGEGIVRLDDVTQDPRYGQNPPYHGLPPGHLPVRSYLAVPVVSRSGEVIGGLFFAHAEPGVFSARHERIAAGIATQAAIAVDNARLYREQLQAEERYRTLVEHIPAVVYIEDIASGTSYLSPQLEDLLGYPASPTQPTEEWIVLTHPDDRQRLRDEIARSDVTGGPFHVEQRLRHRDGHDVWVSNDAVLVRDADGTPRYWQGFVIDITRRKQAELDARRLSAIVASTDDAILSVTLDGTITSWNAGAERVYGYSAAEIVGRPITTIVPEELHEQARRVLERIRDGAPGVQLESSRRRRDGTLIDVALTISPVLDEHGAVVGASTIARDITARRLLEAELAHQAFHDALTGLPNRALLLDRLEQALAHGRRHGHGVAVLFLDLDNFKVVNDSLGHAIGDQLLVRVAARLRDCTRADDTLARFGGDELALLVGDLHDAGNAIEVAERVLEELRQPLQVQGLMLSITTSIGVAVSLDASTPAGDLLRHADIAMYRAKARGKNQYELFEPALHALALDRLQLEADLREALDVEAAGQLRVVYQPKVELRTGTLAGMEALVRWEHPTRGTISPAQFISLAEESGLIVALGLWVLREACRQAAAWRALVTDADAATVSVNLSARQFRQSDLSAQIAAILAETELDPGCLMLEITESVVMDDAAEAIDRLRELKDLGVQLAIDDFGTGYSSLAYLKRFPVDVLKIDQSFVAGLGVSGEDTAIVAAIVTLAHSLGIAVVAEGVETSAQLRQLRHLGCDRAQGFFFAQPMPAGMVPEYLRENLAHGLSRSG